MSTVNLRLPNFLQKEESISINQFISTALAEKMSALGTQKYLEDRPLRRNRDIFNHAFSKIDHNNPLDKMMW